MPNFSLPDQSVLFPEVFSPSSSLHNAMPISILVIDDEQRARQSVCDLLKPLGHRLVQAESVSEAVKWLEMDNFSLALVDLNLPDGTGHDIMRYIQDHQITTRLIVVSGESSFDHATQSLRNGACDFLRKPYLPTTLLESVSTEIAKVQTQHRYHQIQDELKGSEALHRFIVNNSPDIIYMLDQEGRFSFVNKRVQLLLGYSDKNLIGQHYSSIVYGDDIEKAQFVFNERRTGDRASHAVELRLLNRHNKEIRFVEARSLSVELTSMGVYRSGSGEHEEFIGTYGVIRDITERKRSEALQHYHQYHDHLTDLPNRTLFHDRLHMALAQARRNSHNLAVLFLDIDRFRMINDSLGHLAGDKILQRITQRLSTNLREEDTLARIGSDEFLLLLPNIKTSQDAITIAEKINQSCSVPMSYQEQDLRLTFSIGIATFPEDGTTREELIRCAELAKCQVKQNGRHGCLLYQPQYQHQQVSALEMETAIRQGLQQDQFELYYQPQVDPVAQRVVGLEALIRWNHPQQGLLNPSLFIPVAEQSSLICELGQWAVDRACRDARLLEERSLTGLKIAVNVSIQQFERPSFAKNVLESVSLHGLESNHLEIEITESNIMKNMDRGANLLTSLAEHGIGVAIDDFGTGYSSLSYLQTLPVSKVKIDRSFICNLSGEKNGLPIVIAVLNLAAALNIHCVAEGVENEQQKQILQDAGCRLIQGFYYSSPLSFAQLIPYLKQSKNGRLIHQEQMREVTQP
ncbi:EAL domain-containing protein [Desulfuromonas acetoxidans]|uniref:Response regulator receiver modulated diguanylate cyclase/phosphodiesterase with PAS/PAC sensor(S) n=1 Tax=Desulfuromonas acetoxidans (strain DSM 684 / 11070) TaxID=281689 RepID=Q1JWS1_DESA6|nr:EAL domain-containing protein [Desulfuromonas acetoxidans]EAT14723.1 response regulator receiver modulated diguanylate cyclase/phosphodiesterase with PAS/PAC sensor(s) [Desulfuromonas acetoxidans DSM 684]MBF0647002.1 EAL domain-containing protein [Desulfuromonas acetoxidans]NVD26193.1 EAL domain-containing protein [Desulfuromonas acetoxidans]NVE18057.1 EAL domain-containing protein [Desulfuromonas acetoxidans]